LSEFYWRGLIYVGVQSALVRCVAERRVVLAVVLSGALSTLWMANSGAAKATTWGDCLWYGFGAAVATAFVLVL
jgi:hypothetical protein